MFADMSIKLGSAACLLNSASKVERKGFRDDMGLPLLVGVCREGEGMAGEPALLRNGLLEGNSTVRPGEGRRSVDKGAVISWSSFSSPATYVKQVIKEPYLALTALRSSCCRYAQPCCRVQSDRRAAKLGRIAPSGVEE